MTREENKVEMIKALVVRPGGVLTLDERPRPEPGPGEARVRVRFGGICGSDLHYVSHGNAGSSVLVDPMVLGHEVSGELVDPGDSGIATGSPVAIHPAAPCDACSSCVQGRRNLCPNVIFMGSAARRPHSDGAFQDEIAVPIDQLVPFAPGTDLRAIALTEPLAVGVKAVRSAGAVEGRSVLVHGAGPIGQAIIVALRGARAASVTALDLSPLSRRLATHLGADAAVTAEEIAGREFDVVIEATGVASIWGQAVSFTRRGGTLVQVGLMPAGEVSLPMAQLITREINLIAVFRYDHEFGEAAAQVSLDPYAAMPMVTHEYAVEDFEEAFRMAADRSVASKVLLRF